MNIATRAGVHDERAPADVMARYPGATVGREFISVKQLPAPRDIRPDLDRLAGPWLAAGGGAYISFKPAPDAVAKGQWTTHLRQVGAWLADHRTCAVIVHHEPANDMTGPVFAAMFNRARAEIKAGWVRAPVAYCAMAYQWRPRGIAALDPTGWQKAVADQYLVDVYSGKSFPENATLRDHAGFAGWLKHIVQPRLDAGEAVDWGISERGFQAKDPAVRAATIRAESAWLSMLFDNYTGADTRTRPPMLYLAWATPGTEGNAAWRFDQAAEQAMAELVRRFAPPAAAPAATDRYSAGYTEGYTAGFDAGAGSRDDDVAGARLDGARAAYDDVARYATAAAPR